MYLGQLDGKLVALDRKTGRVAWSTQVARYQQGYTITKPGNCPYLCTVPGHAEAGMKGVLKVT